MGPATPLSAVLSSPATWERTITVLADSTLFYIAASFLVTYLGLGLSALTLPQRLRPALWLVAPLAGYSTLVTISGLLVAFGADIRISLVAALVACTPANLWLVSRGKHRLPSGSPPEWIAVLVLSASSFAITAATMAHNGTVAYVGGQADLYLLGAIAEWIKAHSAPLFSLGPPFGLSPYWNANLPPIGGWSIDGAHLGGAGHRFDDANFLLQRGPVYLAGSLGILLGWDGYSVFRPAQAFMLSLCIPSTFLFARYLLGATSVASLLAALFVELNGTLLFWVSYGHPGQAAGLFLVPAAILLVVAAIESATAWPVLPAALLLSALLVSYYQGAPLLLFLLAPAICFLLVTAPRRRPVLWRSMAIAIAALLLSFPEQLKVGLVWFGGALVETSGWGDSQFAPLSDALGTSLFPQAYNRVVPAHLATSPAMVALQWGSLAATVIALLLFLLGVWRGTARRMGLYRTTLLGGAVMLAVLRLADYRYGFSKGLAALTFLFATAMALGATGLWSQIRQRRSDQGPLARPWPAATRWVAVLTGLTMIGMMSANLALSAFIWWKPLGNIWDPAAWKAGELGAALPASSVVRLSPNLLIGPEASFATLYGLRQQQIAGQLEDPALALAGQLKLSARGILGLTEAPPADVDLLGANEVAAVQGLTASDMIWSSPLLKGYRRPIPERRTPVVRPDDGTGIGVPCRLPVTIEAAAGAGPPSPGEKTASTGLLLLTLASDTSGMMGVTTGHASSTLQIGKGISVRSIPIELPDRIGLSWSGSGRPALLSAVVRTGDDLSPAEEDYPRVLAVVGSSTLHGNTISTSFTYLNAQVPVSHSLDIWNAAGTTHAGWFELPTNPDERVTDVRFDLDGRSLEHRSTANGSIDQRNFTTSTVGDGEYVAYWSTWSGNGIAKRIPLYSYRLERAAIVDFEAFPLVAVWDGRFENTAGSAGP